MAPSVPSSVMLLKERSSQVRELMLMMILCFWRLVRTLPSPARESILLFDSLTFLAPSP